MTRRVWFLICIIQLDLTRQNPALHSWDPPSGKIYRILVFGENIFNEIDLFVNKFCKIKGSLPGFE
jgi:hypothetical protein